MAQTLMEVRNVGKRFGENVVLKGVNFDLAPGEILGLVGENGAGKSTLMNIIFGMEVIRETGGYDGEILLDGAAVNFRSPIDALKAGIGMVHQEFNLIPGFTAAENITLDMERTKPSVLSKVLGKKYATVDGKANIRLSGESLDKLGVEIDPEGMVSEMPVGHKQFIEIAREITREDVKLIIMDEPTAVLTESEADMLMASLKRLSDLGIAIVFISHRLREILTVCDTVVVLRDGEIIENRKNENLSVDQIAAWMVGRTEEARTRKRQPMRPGETDVLLKVRNLNVDMPGEQVDDVNLDVYRGEILGIAGLAGQGKLGIANGILGTYPVMGNVEFQGKPLALGKTAKILAEKIAFVSEDRRGVGLLLDEPIYWNISFNAMQIQNKFIKKVMGLSFRDEETMKKVSDAYIENLAIKCMGSHQKAGNLSGGNQQKVCLAKALCMEPELLFVSEPTRGIDIGAKELVLSALEDINEKEGTTIVMISSELEELRSICDRIAVICEGKIAGILSPEAPAAQFGLLMSGEEVEVENVE
ncbi:Galactose/methyl galactoside import ATP-binding protein MglA [Aedoeadaptatus ivorii]|uniref:Galactose/methyl galactoside import ATP-binding protein MglA n=2 Tax=Aedoeadaptatus ivorii TaxID=54006 RepID=A0A448V259_9FIRM|nr:sugar ABC transporter ATP-binding protein [Peptoniphilus ivorii]VEJ35913.1 Galactose/methyl galactoside import ATP-binding protein MglA [Peptoniphilus ivorii]